MNLSYAITKWPNCGVGNKLLYYWNLVQAANARGIKYESPPDKDVDSLIKIGYIRTQEMRKIIPFDFCLGEHFYKYTENRVPIEKIFKLQSPDTYLADVISIHLRGGDFRYWKNGEGMLDFEYYKNAIDYVTTQTKGKLWFTILTDDPNHPHKRQIEDYLYKKCYRVMENPRSSMVRDWNIMVGSKWIISSPSTFAITAGMISNANIVHSEKWVKNRVNDNDAFWVGLNNGGNHEYKAEVLI